MIQVNLLPPEKRPPEGTSPARLTAIILGVLVPVLGLLLDFSYISKTHELKQETSDLDAKNTTLNKEIAALTATTKQIAEFEKKTAAIDDLRKGRMLWGRFHYRFFQMMTALDTIDSQGPENNVILRRFGMRKESNDKFNIDLGVMILGSSQESISKRQAEFMNLVNRYSGASLMDDPEVVHLAVELQNVASTEKLTDAEMAGLSALDIQRKQYEREQADLEKRVAEIKKRYRVKWNKQFESEPAAKLAAHIDQMMSDADELLKINNFSGLIFEKLAPKRVDPTPVDYPAPKAGTEFVYPQKEASKVDFSLAFRVSRLVNPK